MKFYPYEGILFLILADEKTLRGSGNYEYPKFPFVAFAD
jgi:hypothetical protein